MSLAKPDAVDISTKQKVALAIGIVGLFILTLALFNTEFPNKGVFLSLALGLISIGSRGVWGWIVGIILTTFYIVLYFFPKYLGLGTDGAENTGLISLFDPLSKLLSGRPASQWFVYGALYTVAIIAFGYKFILKYRHNRYQQVRTISVMFFQLGFAFLIPEFMYVMNNSLPYYDLKSMWPLNYYIFDEWSVNGFLSNGNIKMSAWKIERWLIHTVLVFSVVMTTAMIYTYLGYDKNDFWLTRGLFIALVIGFLTLVFAGVMFFKGKELGKDAKYGAIGFFVVIGALLIMHFTGTTDNIFYIKGSALRSAYGLYIGSIFSGVIGTGFYPILGSRSWCRFGCPMAAILGFQQRLFSKFRITTNGGQCISCGNCSNSCEMGIDVRHYAQKGENIVRSSCVGCGICSAVCPRGVLKLENDGMEGRINPTEILLGNDVDLMDLVNKK